MRVIHFGRIFQDQGRLQVMGFQFDLEGMEPPHVDDAEACRLFSDEMVRAVIRELARAQGIEVQFPDALAVSIPYNLDAERQARQIISNAKKGAQP